MTKWGTWSARACRNGSVDAAELKAAMRALGFDPKNDEVTWPVRVALLELHES